MLTSLRQTAPLRVAVLTSRWAPGLAHLLAHPDRGQAWDIVGLVASDPAGEGLALTAGEGIPVLVHDIRSFCRRHGARLDDLGTRRAFDLETRSFLLSLRPGLLALTGYRHIVTGPLLSAYPDRVVNLHDSDLARLGPDGLPRYRGLRSTRDAMMAGEIETRLTTHLATAEVDLGPLLVRSWPFPVPPFEAGQVKPAARAQRARMIEEAWGPTLAATIGHFARGEVRRVETWLAIGGRPGPVDLAPPALAEVGAEAWTEGWR
jgi:folate-dependent phosphoribosylglycinamide formyltransferase PurN